MNTQSRSALDVPAVPLKNVTSKPATWNPTHSSSEASFTYIDLGAVDQQAKLIVGARDVRTADAPSRARQLVAAGDVLVATVRPNLNGVARVPSQLDGATASTGFCVLRPEASAIDSGYLFQWVRSPRFVREMVKRATGANYPAVSETVVRESLIPLPPLDEQRRIADVLGRVDVACQKRRDALDESDAVADATFSRLFGDPVRNDRGWDVVPLLDVANVTYGYPFDSKRFTSEGDVPVVRIRDVVVGSSATFLRGEDPSGPEHQVKNGDILVGMDGEFNCARWRGGEARLNQRVCRFASASSQLSDAYLFHALPCFLKRIEAETPYVTVKHLSARQIGAIRLPLPSVPLQEQFEACVAVLERIRQKQARSREGLAQLFAALQHLAFTGGL